MMLWAVCLLSIFLSSAGDSWFYGAVEISILVHLDSSASGSACLPLSSTAFGLRSGPCVSKSLLLTVEHCSIC